MKKIILSLFLSIILINIVQATDYFCMVEERLDSPEAHCDAGLKSAYFCDIAIDDFKMRQKGNSACDFCIKESELKGDCVLGIIKKGNKPNSVSDVTEIFYQLPIKTQNKNGNMIYYFKQEENELRENSSKCSWLTKLFGGCKTDITPDCASSSWLTKLFGGCKKSDSDHLKPELTSEERRMKIDNSSKIQINEDTILINPAGRVISKKGRVFIERGIDIVSIEKGTLLYPGDIIVIEDESNVVLFVNGETINITQPTKFQIPSLEPTKRRTSRLTLFIGGLWNNIKKMFQGESFDIKNPSSGGTGVRG